MSNIRTQTRVLMKNRFPKQHFEIIIKTSYFLFSKLFIFKLIKAGKCIPVALHNQSTDV